MKPQGSATTGNGRETDLTESLRSIRQHLESAEEQLRQAKQLVSSLGLLDDTTDLADERVGIAGGTMIEGLFDGEAMIDKSGKQYPVPPNYASKSKLVVGDRLKLTILPDGKFLYKQIGPVERRHERGVVEKEGSGYRVAVDDKRYRVLLASITFHKASIGDEVSIIIPDEIDSDWATLDSVLEKVAIGGVIA